VRPRPGAPVATPLAWDELEDSGLRPDGWTLRTVGARLERDGDPWAAIARSAGGLPRLR
jgi:bifunctional non-homologous end joining protein LigD